LVFSDTFLLIGTTVTWVIAFFVVKAAIFTAPPYNFSTSQVGLIALSPLVLTIIGECIADPLNDWIYVKMTKVSGIQKPA
jgi:hypothetical protein